MASAVCWLCIEDEYLKSIIKERGEVAECSLCSRSDESVFTPDDFSEILDPLMREHFAQGPEVKKFGEEDSEWWEQEGDPLSHHLQEVIGQYLGFEDEIIEALEANEDVRPQDGEEAFFDSAQEYVPVPVRPYRYLEEWTFALNELKHRRRFFNTAAKALFSELFSGVETRHAWNKSGGNEDVVIEFPQAAELYRARICASVTIIKEAFSDPFKNVGPPPPERSRAGRMNAEGMAVFYGSLDLETCLAETRPALGNETAVIKLGTTKSLRLLDFNRLERSYTRLSYFQPDFTEQCEKGAFLRKLQRLISQPIIPGREIDYIITQSLAEYLAHVHETPFDGILFQSVQRSDGTNIVLFPDVEGKFPLSYIDRNVTLYATRSIQYTHEQKYVHLTEDGLWIDNDFDEDEW